MRESPSAPRPPDDAARGAYPTPRAADLLAGVAGLVVTSYVALRAVLVPVTHDEAFSYLRFVDAPFAEAFSFHRPHAANNHLLLTLLDRVVVSVLGPSEIVLRLPVLAAFVAALVAAWLLLRGRCPPAVALAGFLAFAANRLGTELFSLARGYGLAVGLCLCGLALLVRSVEKGPRTASPVAGLSLLVLAALAQLVVLDVWAAATLAVLLVALVPSPGPGASPRAGRRAFLRSLATVALPALACGVTAIPIALSLKAGGALYAGGKGGLLADTVGTLVRETLEPAPWAGALRGVLTVAIVLAAGSVGVVVLLLVARRAGNDGSAGTLLVGSTFLVAVAAVEAQVRLLGVGYPVDRMAYPLLPLLFLSTCLSAGWLLRGRGPRLRRVADVLAAVVSVAAVTQLVATADVSRSRLWWFDADLRSVLEEIERRVSAPAEASVSVGASWILEPALNYHRVVRGLSWLRPIDRTGLEGRRDFYVVAAPDAGGAAASGLSALVKFEAAGTVLAVAGPGRIRTGVPVLAADGALPGPPSEAPSDDPENVVWVPVVVRATGLDGAEWRSDLKVVNRSASPAWIVFGMKWQGALRQAALGVPAGAEVTVSDVAGQLGVEGAGPLEARSPGDVEISARVRDATRTRGKTADGQGWFPSVRPGEGLAVGSVGRLEGLEESGRVRSNVGLLNLGPTVADVVVTYFDSGGKVLGTSRLVLQPGEGGQETRPIAGFAGGAEVVGASARVAVERGRGVVAWATVIDSVTREVRVVRCLR